MAEVVTELYPEIERYAHGLLDVGDDQRIYWEQCGNPQGKPAVVLHGGPGSGFSPWWRRLFDPAAYRIVLFDQRQCERSLPHASTPEADLSVNTTAHLVADIERLREHLELEHWLVLGGSWGSTLALAYAETYPERVTELVLFGVTTGRHTEFDWLFRGGLARFFPQQWDRLVAALPEDMRAGDIVEAYHALLYDSDPHVRQRAANAWCLWESADLEWPPADAPMDWLQDPATALAYARLVTHYVRHNGFLEDGILLRNADRLAAIPGVLVNGLLDFQSPIGNAWALQRAWPSADLLIIGDAGHGGSGSTLSQGIVTATNRFSTTGR